MTVSGTASLADRGFYTVTQCSGPFGSNCHSYNVPFDSIVDPNVPVPTQTMVVSVLNVALAISRIAAPSEVRLGEDSDFFAMAFDPGALDVLTFAWDLDEDGDFDDWLGASGTYAFPHASPHTISCGWTMATAASPSDPFRSK